MPRDKLCSSCELGDTTHQVCSWGQGPKNAKVMLIGEAPGAREEDLDKPFQGKSGKLLEEFLLKAGLHRKDLYITNAVKCRPPDNRTPSKKEIAICKYHLEDEIKEIKPQYILVLGATAFTSIFNKAGIMEHRGSIIEKGGISYLISLHPSAALRMPKLRPLMEADLTRFKQLMDGKLEENSSMEWTLVNDIPNLKAFIRDLKSAKSISYDIECSSLNGLDPNSYIYCIGFSTKRRSWVIPFDYPESNFRNKNVQYKLIRIIEKVTRGKNLIAHNGKFDNKWIKSKYGLQMEQTFDTMLASFILDENRPHGLKPLSKMYLNASDYDLKFPFDVRNVPLETLAKYCAYDVRYTLQLYYLFKEQLKEDAHLSRVFYGLIMPASKYLELTETEGVYIDQEKYPVALKQITQEVSDLEKELCKIAGKTLNWNSSPQMANLLFTELKLPVLETTPTGKPSTSGENVLPRLRDKHPIINVLLDYREKIKLSQFLISWGTMMDRTGRVHPSFKLHGTVTGRLSCKDPNFQQVPRDVFLRSLFTAPQGWVFVEADYSQVELRVAAMLANETNMKRAYQTGQDIHQNTASLVMGIPMDKVTKEDRKKAKAVNFGFLYGMSSKKFKDYARDKYQVTLTDNEASQFRTRFFDAYPELLAWHDRQRRIVQKYGYVRSPIGRKRRLPEINSPDRGVKAEAERQSINSPVQGFASDMCLFSMVRLSQEIPRDQFKVVGLVHDAMMGIIKEEYVDLIVPKIKQVMEDMATVEKVFYTSISVPIEVDVKIGPWGSGKDWTPNKPKERE